MLDVLAHCHEFETFSSGPQYAAHLASSLDASLTGLYVAPPLESSPRIATQSSLTAEFLAYVREELDRAQSARHEFARWAGRIGVRTSHWQVALGDLPEVLVAAGNGCDMLVIEHRARAPHDSISTIGKTLMRGVPCIVVPEAAERAQPMWERIAIAWNGSTAAVRAVHAALPLLRMARHICLLSTSANIGRSRQDGEPNWSMEKYLERHDLAASSVVIDAGRREVDAAILAESAGMGVDLLVMGAFGTTRFHPRNPRGIACRILTQSLLPVFIRN